MPLDEMTAFEVTLVPLKLQNNAGVGFPSCTRHATMNVFPFESVVFGSACSTGLAEGETAKAHTGNYYTRFCGKCLQNILPQSSANPK